MSISMNVRAENERKNAEKAAIKAAREARK